MPRKFDFLSPGIEIREIDQSVLPPAADEEGPIIIGRTRRGPALKPIKIRSRDDFFSIFGRPIAGGGGSEGDIWRAGPNVSSPAYAAYAAQAWLASGESPVTMVRLLGEQHSEASAAGYAGWQVTNSKPSATSANNGTAYGLFLVDSSSCAAGSSAYMEAVAITVGSGDTGDYDAETFIVTDGAGTALTFEFTDLDVNAILSNAAYIAVAYNASSETTDALVAVKIKEAIESKLTDGTLVGLSVDVDSNKVTITNVSTAGAADIKRQGTSANILQHTSGTGHTASVATTALGTAGALAAIFYADSGYMTLSGNLAVAGTLTGACGHLIKSDSNNGWKIDIFNSTDTKLETVNFTFDRNDTDYIRRSFNTDPEKVNSTNNSSTELKTYWLGETYERFMKKKVTGTTAASVYGVLLPLHKTDVSAAANNWAYRRESMKTATSGWVISQDVQADDSGGSSTYDATSNNHAKKLFRVELLEEGEALQRDIIISFEDLAFAPNPTVYAYATFTMRVRDASSGETLEKYSNCSLDSNSPSYIAKKIGDQSLVWSESDRRYRKNGSFINRSDYIRIVMYADTENYLKNALPFGFLGMGRPKGFGFVAGDASPKALDTLTDFTGAFAVHSLNVPLGGLGSSNVDFIHPSSVTAGRFEFPAVPLRESGSEGYASNQYKTMWGVRPKISTTSTLFDADYVDYIRRLPSNYADTHTLSPSDDFEHSVIFTLDDIRITEHTDTVFYVSGSRNGGSSYTARSGSSALLKKSVKQWAMPVFGGFDGLDIKEKEPFSNSLINTSADTLNYVNYSLNKAIDSINDSENVPASLLMAPGIYKTNITSKLLNIAETRQDVLAIIDLEGDYVPKYERAAGVSEASSIGDVTDVVTNLKSRSLNTSYGCAFFPWVQIVDNLNNDAVVWIPPSIAALGAMAQSQAATDVWFAPAGFNRGGLGNLGGRRGPRVLQARQRLDSSERDDLYEVNINPIATFPNEGVVIFGQKTLQQTQSALDRINVRRLMLYLKSKITTVAKTVLFDNNVPATWERFKAQAEPLLQDVQARFGLSDYRLILDETTTTPDLIDRNILYAKVFLKPARAIEFIAIDFVITSTGAEFA